MPDDMPRLTEDTLRRFFAAPIWERGRPYTRNGSVRDLHRHGATLHAFVHGSAPQPYRITVTLGAQGVMTADCSCPVGSGGACKHIAAVLQVWLAGPDAATERASAESLLRGMKADDLVALALRMLTQYPELEAMLASPLVTAAPVSSGAYRDRAASLLGQPEDYDHFDGYGGIDTRGINALVAEGATFTRRGDYRAAANVYLGVAAQITDNYDEWYSQMDEESELLVTVGRCADGLIACLPHEADGGWREEILETLFGMTVFPYDIPTETPLRDALVREATLAEKRLLAGWVRARLGFRPDRYDRADLGGFLLMLDADTLDDADYLRLCEELGLVREGVERLLTLGNRAKALATAQGADDRDTLPIADLFVRHKARPDAEAFVQGRMAGAPGWLAGQLHDWLKHSAVARGDLSTALALATEAFRAAPSLTGYQELRQFARSLGQWDALRPEMQDAVRPTKHRAAAIDIALDERDIPHALALAQAAQEPIRTNPFGTVLYGHGDERVIAVATAAAPTHPAEARALYLRAAEEQIAHKNCDHYREAARYFVAARELYDRTDQFDEWLVYRDDLLRQHPRLRALREEMQTAGLLD